MIARLLLIVSLAAAAQAAPPTRESVWAESLPPYTGASAQGVDRSTLTGKVMTGYQGWFNCEGDGAERGWVHWTKRRGGMVPGNAKIDMWPDVSELTDEEKFPTGFQHADGSVAHVFSSYKRPTVLRHFQWMRDYGIDGAFVQRFIVDLRNPRGLHHNNTVLGHCREGAHQSGRAYAVMYDLSGLGAGRIAEVMEDWRELRKRLIPEKDAAYLRHRGKPLVAVWGIGFNDNRAYTLAECRELVEFLKADGCTVMLGVPTYWREQKGDALADPALHDVLKLADVVSPWTVGRYRDLSGVKRHAEQLLLPDLAWCRENQLEYLPVAFPGFSWHNMKGGPLNDIPRLGGRFLWAQFAAAKRAGAEMFYVAMFDEVDEGTAIFKLTDTVPTQGGSAFVGLEGLPNDHYLRLTGRAGKILRGEIPVTDEP